MHRREMLKLSAGLLCGAGIPAHLLAGAPTDDTVAPRWDRKCSIWAELVHVHDMDANSRCVIIPYFLLDWSVDGLRIAYALDGGLRDEERCWQCIRSDAIDCGISRRSLNEALRDMDETVEAISRTSEIRKVERIRSAEWKRRGIDQFVDSMRGPTSLPMRAPGQTEPSLP